MSKDRFVIERLMRKRAELAADILAAEKFLTKARRDLQSLDDTLRLFETPKVSGVVTVPAKHSREHLFQHGEFTRRLIDVMRDAREPLIVGEIARRVMFKKGLDVLDAALWTLTLAMTRECLRYKARRGITIRIGGFKEGLWTLS